MKYLPIFMLIALFGQATLANNTLFIPVNNTVSNNPQADSTYISYGLTDDEIAKRIKMGLIDTIPLSALIKWQQSQYKEQQIEQQTLDANQTLQEIPPAPSDNRPPMQLNIMPFIQQGNMLNLNNNHHLDNTNSSGVLSLQITSTVHTPDKNKALDEDKSSNHNQKPNQQQRNTAINSDITDDTNNKIPQDHQ